jgi:hypothetical protein
LTTVNRTTSAWGAHASGVLVAAFSGDGLLVLSAANPGSSTHESSFRQNAETSRLKACAPQAVASIALTPIDAP